MQNISIWKDIGIEECPRIERNFKTDVLIVGGGITGLSVLYFLENSGLKVSLVERNVCGFGVTGGSTAKITYLQENTTLNISSWTNEEKAKDYIESQVYATELLSNIISNEKIDCDLKKVSSIIFTNSKAKERRILELYELYKSCGIEVEISDEVLFELPMRKAIKVDDTYVFHPLKYINALKAKFKDRIYEHSKVENVRREGDYYIAAVGGYEVKAKYVVMTTHYPHFLVPYLFPAKTHIEVSYLGAKRCEDVESYSAINLDKPKVSMRFLENGKTNHFIYLLNSFIACNVGDISENFKKLENAEEFDYLWSNNDVITGDYMPYVGALSKTEGNFLIATGYNTWGMTNGTLAGEIIADMITGRENRFQKLFDSLRKINLSRFLRVPIDLGCSAKAYLVSTQKSVNNARVSYTKIDGVDVAIYRDEKGIEHIVLNRCPHMKCGITFNEKEKTWDCLCHGSRFDLDGKCIEGPANYDITFDREDV